MEFDVNSLLTTGAACGTALASIGATVKLILAWLDKRDERVFSILTAKLEEQTTAIKEVSISTTAIHQSVIDMQKWLLLHDQRTNSEALPANDPLYRTVLEDNLKLGHTLDRILSRQTQELREQDASRQQPHWPYST